MENEATGHVLSRQAVTSLAFSSTAQKTCPPAARSMHPRPFVPALPAYICSLYQEPAHQPSSPATMHQTSSQSHHAQVLSRAASFTSPSAQRKLVACKQTAPPPYVLASYTLFTYDTFIPSWQSREEALPFCPIKGHQRQEEKVGHRREGREGSYLGQEGKEEFWKIGLAF